MGNLSAKNYCEKEGITPSSTQIGTEQIKTLFEKYSKVGSQSIWNENYFGMIISTNSINLLARSHDSPDSHFSQQLPLPFLRGMNA